jgi:hypothetical protein
MSTYSEQVELVLNGKIVPKMNELALEVARIEPYSYSNTVLEDYKRQLDYYSLIYDFLYEYSVGNEELENSKLLNITRLVNSPTQKRIDSDYLGIRPNINKKLGPGYTIYINESVLDSSTILVPGTTIDISAIYTPSRELVGEKSIKVFAAGVLSASTGFECNLQNRTVQLSSGGGSFSLVVQAYLDGILIPPIQAPIVIPIRQTIEDVYYYGATVAGATEAQIRALTRLIEGRGNKTLKFTASNQKLYFAYPQSYGALSSIVDQNGFDVTTSFILTSGVLFNLQSPNYGSGTAFYNVYESNALTTVTNFGITFNF